MDASLKARSTRTAPRDVGLKPSVGMTISIELSLDASLKARSTRPPDGDDVRGAEGPHYRQDS